MTIVVRRMLVMGSLMFVCMAAAGARSDAKSEFGPISLSVDATDAPRKIFHAKLVIPASPGPLTLLYPKWLPGEHGPTGPITDLAGIKFSAGGNPVAWNRDLADMFTFHCNVPAGARAVEVSLDFLSPTSLEGFSSAASATSQLAVMSWNQLLLYPQGIASDDLTYHTSLRLPPGWRVVTSMAVEKDSGQEITFKPVSLTTLIDSPLLAGAHYRAIPLSYEGDPPVELDLVSDSEAALAITPKLAESYERLVAETFALFGGHHFRHYNFLYTLSDHVASFGLEHHESSDNRTPERTLLDDNLRKVHADLLPHEFVHSWNGKYRRPADLATPDYQAPMRTDLLWVYEGLTQYLGKVLTARSGLMSPGESRESIAWLAATLDRTPGRTWRPLLDTAVAAQLLYNAPRAWASWRRSVDFYDEGVLIWLEADALIRAQTKGQRTLDDFCRRFHGGKSGPKVNTYTLDDVVAAMKEVLPHDWKAFFTGRVEKISDRAPLGGIEASGWKLVYTSEPNDFMRATEETAKILDLRFSAGIVINNDPLDPRYGALIDVIHGSPAAEAGAAPGMKLVAVNGRRWSADLLRDTLRSTQGTTGRFDLLLENGEFFRTYSLNYHEGEKYPHLQRDALKPDLLSEIFKPKKNR